MGRLSQDHEPLVPGISYCRGTCCIGSIGLSLAVVRFDLLTIHATNWQRFRGAIAIPWEFI
eukprot:1328454-Amphidinium_carterae.1